MRSSHHYTYADARAAFLERIASAQHQFIEHPLPGPDGAIGLDLAFWPGANPSRVVVVSSATHGIEGYCGSFVQCALLDDGLAARCTEQHSLLMLHAVNPHGFAWQRRVNENNVDLNRNFLNFSEPLPVNDGYDAIAQIIEPAVWGEDTEQALNMALLAEAQKHEDALRWLQGALSGGQHRYPNGQFYGGTEPQWSNVQMHAIAAEYLSGRDVVWLDVHTALGEFGTAVCITEASPGSKQAEAADRFWGERVQNLQAGDGVSVAVSGTMIGGVERDQNLNMVGAGLEYGTVPVMEVGSALIQDQWFHRYCDPRGPDVRGTKARMMNAFYPDSDLWRESVLDIAREVAEATLTQAWAHERGAHPV